MVVHLRSLLGVFLWQVPDWTSKSVGMKKGTKGKAVMCEKKLNCGSLPGGGNSPMKR